jgi:hypothetical protein
VRSSCNGVLRGFVCSSAALDDMPALPRHADDEGKRLYDGEYVNDVSDTSGSPCANPPCASTAAAAPTHTLSAAAAVGAGTGRTTPYTLEPEEEEDLAANRFAAEAQADGASAAGKGATSTYSDGDLRVVVYASPTTATQRMRQAGMGWEALRHRPRPANIATSGTSHVKSADATMGQASLVVEAPSTPSDGNKRQRGTAKDGGYEYVLFAAPVSMAGVCTAGLVGQLYCLGVYEWVRPYAVCLTPTSYVSDPARLCALFVCLLCRPRTRMRGLYAGTRACEWQTLATPCMTRRP